MIDTQRTKLRQIAQAAVASERATGCPAELQAAQCILETGWLAHAPGNNCFGIKSSPSDSGRQVLHTHEWLTPAELDQFLAASSGRTAELVQPAQHDARGRSLYSVQDWFATFPTLADCFARRAAFFDTGRFAPFADAWRRDRDLEALVRGIAPIYATDPAYAQKVLGFIFQAEVRDEIASARAALPTASEVTQ